MVPILYTNIFPDVFHPPSLLRNIFRPSPPTPAPGVASGGAPAPAAASGGTPAPGASSGGPAPAAGAASSGAPTPTPGPAPPARGPAPHDATPSHDQSASAAAARPNDHPLTHVPAPAVVSFNTNRSPSPALSALTEMSYGSMTSIESEEPTLPPKPRQHRWDINSTALIGTPAKAPTKANVGALLKELYDLETTKAVDEKYTEFRLAIDTIAKRTLASGTFTQQNPDKVQQLYNELSKVYPWFSRCVDGWAARPYLLERQRNTMKRHAIKQEVKVGREAKKVLGSLRRTHSGSHKQATLLIMRKTRSFNPASGSQ
ncbi:hypothetical protein DFH07DRAFT_777593 [Mycena maculata]|uniref:Uncharacterized protein n=1 Tax=Mycena maculata TaxID=230809 RepID=A0AAD7IH38_9AGAR|nr:hypothetical protein DFH07DRAFT_777593 [Mycena maculata]